MEAVCCNLEVDVNGEEIFIVDKAILLCAPLFLFNIYFSLNRFSKIPCLVANLILLCLFNSASTELYSTQLLLQLCVPIVVQEFNLLVWIFLCLLVLSLFFA